MRSRTALALLAASAPFASSYANLPHALQAWALRAAGKASGIERCLRELDDRALATRQGAQHEIAKLLRAAPDSVYDLLSRPDLSCEQRLRLEIAGKDLFAASARGALGVEFEMPEDPHDRRVLVRATLPRFPAHALLKPGDEITHVAGQRVEDREMVRSLIVAHRAGERVAVRVLRDGLGMDLSVPLGEFSLLSERPFPVEGDLLDESFEARALILGKSTPAPSPEHLTPSPLPASPAALAAPGPAASARPNWMLASAPRVSRTYGQTAFPLAAGTPSPRPLETAMLRAQAQGGQNPEAGTVFTQEQFPADFARVQIEHLEEELARNEALLLDPSLPDSTRRGLAQTNALYRQTLDALREQTRELP